MGHALPGHNLADGIPAIQIISFSVKSEFGLHLYHREKDDSTDTLCAVVAVIYPSALIGSYMHVLVKFDPFIF